PVSGVSIPDYTKTTTHRYDDARAALSKFGAIGVPSFEGTNVNGTDTSAVQTVYVKDSPLPSATHKTVYAHPPVDAVLTAATSDPAVLGALRALAVRTRDEVSTFTYDAYGNVVTKSDAVGLVETAAYDAKGVLPTEHHKVNLGDRTLDPVTAMTYRPDGRMAS